MASKVKGSLVGCGVQIPCPPHHILFDEKLNHAMIPKSHYYNLVDFVLSSVLYLVFLMCFSRGLSGIISGTFHVNFVPVSATLFFLAGSVVLGLYISEVHGDGKLEGDSFLSVIFNSEPSHQPKDNGQRQPSSSA